MLFIHSWYWSSTLGRLYHIILALVIVCPCMPLASWANGPKGNRDRQNIISCVSLSIGKILSDSHQVCNICVISMGPPKVFFVTLKWSLRYFCSLHCLVKDCLGSIEMYCNEMPWAHFRIFFGYLRIFWFTSAIKDWLGSIGMHCNDTPWAHSTIPFIKLTRNHMRGKYYSGPDHFPTKIFISGSAITLADLF